MNSRFKPTATTSAKATIDLLGLTDFLKSPGTRKLYSPEIQIASYQKEKATRFLSTAFINAGNDLRSHTLGACSTIGPAGLNFRVRDGNGWIPRGKITDNS